MTLEKWVQNLANSTHKHNHTHHPTSREKTLREHDSWHIFTELCDRYTSTFNRFSQDKMTFHHTGLECQLSFGRSQLSFQLLTGMIRSRLTRVEGYDVEQLLDHHLLADHDGFGGLYWKLDHRVFSEDMLLRLTLEALISTQNHTFHKVQQHEHQISKPRP